MTSKHKDTKIESKSLLWPQISSLNNSPVLSISIFSSITTHNIQHLWERQQLRNLGK